MSFCVFIQMYKKQNLTFGKNLLNKKNDFIILAYNLISILKSQFLIRCSYINIFIQNYREQRWPSLYRNQYVLQ